MTSETDKEVQEEMETLKTTEKEEIDYKNVFNWPPLESNPESLENYLYGIGLGSDWKFEEPLMILPEFLRPPNFNFVPVAVVACLQQSREEIEIEQDNNGKIEKVVRLRKVNDGRPGNEEVKAQYYMKQTHELDNACGIIACLHAILNRPEVNVIPDSILGKFKESVSNLSPAERADALENANDFKEAHKVAAMQGQSRLASTQKEINHHFVAFIINQDGILVELDGTKDGPAVIPILPEARDNPQADHSGEPIGKVSATEFLPAVGAELLRRVSAGLVSEALNVLVLVPKN